MTLSFRHPDNFTSFDLPWMPLYLGICFYFHFWIGMTALIGACILITMTALTEKVQQQRFFCENCHREVFLLAEYCDQCGGKVEWPEKIQKIRASWKKE